MRRIAAIALFSAALVCAESPSITGVWKADLEKSKLQGPPPTNYLVMISQKMAVFDRRTKEEATLITDLTGVWGERGEQRSELTFFSGKTSVRYYRGVPTRLTAAASGNTLVVDGEVDGRPSTFKRTYELSADGQTLTVNETGSNEGHSMQSTVVLSKQSDSAADALRKPEELAGAHFKNVKTEYLKALPASEFINNMRYFSWALNKDCEFCHVEHKFDSDDKEEKRTARKMVEMTAAINEHNFEGHQEVRCFTCHEFHGHPLSRPLFADEAAAMKAREEKEAAEHKQGPPPSH
jgi:hypothetical protein